MQHRFTTFILAVLCLFTADVSNADVWDTPKPAEFISSNQRFVLKVLPGGLSRSGPADCEAVLTEKQANGESVDLCRVKLTNRVAPVDVMVADDGEHFITLDEWGHLGYGPSVLVFYDRKGPLSSYSLEELVRSESMDTPSRWQELFLHSVSSRSWRDHCLMCFGEKRQAGRLGIWLDWKPEWLVWSLSDGKPVKETSELTADWNDLGGQWAHSKIQSGTNVYEKITACRYSLYLHRPEDRHLLLHALRDSSQDQNQREKWVRLYADRALAIWDGVATNFWPLWTLFQGPPKQHYMLGIVDVVLRLPAPATEGQVYLMLFPASVSERNWKEALPEFRGGLSFKTPGPQPSTNEVRFTINPALPGKYWLKAIWDRKAPFTHDLWSWDGAHAWRARTDNVVEYGTGDAETGSPTTFEVKARETVEVTLRCDPVP